MMKKLFTSVLMLLGTFQGIRVQGAETNSDNGVVIYYNYNSEEKTAVVTRSPDWSYSGTIVIPSTVIYEGEEYTVTEIGSGAFLWCSVTSVTIPNSVTSIGDYAFRECHKLTSIDIPNSVTSIGSYAFYECDNLNLTSITFGDNLTFIGDCAFQFCSGLTSVNIPNGVTRIGCYAFLGCNNLTSIDIPNSVTSIGQHAFDGTIWYGNQPDGIVYAGKVAYGYKGEGEMPANTHITLKDGTLGIAHFAFYDCSNMTSIDIPNSVTTIEERAFEKCSGLTSVTLPNSMTTIGYEIFNECISLADLTIPSSVTFIDPYAFWGCDNLTSVTVERQEPLSIYNNTFPNYANATLYVPKGCMEAYRAVKPWSNFGTILETNNNVKEPYAVLSDNNTTLTFYYDNNKASRGGMGVVATEEMNLNTWLFEIKTEWNNQRNTITTVVFDKSFADYKDLTSTEYWFYDCNNLATIIGFDNLNTENVTFMKRMFFGCSSLTSLDVSNFNTANVTDMEYMFGSCSGLTSLDVSNFNTTNVTNISGMFAACRSLTSLDVTGFKTDNVTDMSGLFAHCYGLTSLDVSNFNTANVTDMSTMFNCCVNLTNLNVSNFNTTNVTDMSTMFNWCSGLTRLDVSNFNTANVTNMYRMFEGCSGLTSIYCNDGWSCNLSEDMFTDCTSLVGAISYDGTKTDVTYANPITGYFTAVAKGDANGDGDISDEDVKTVENRIIGNKSTKFVFAGGDSNGDGVVNVADIVDIINKK